MKESVKVLKKSAKNTVGNREKNNKFTVIADIKPDSFDYIMSQVIEALSEPTKTEPTAITEKMANGDVIKTMFPDAEIFYQRDAKVYRVHFDRFEYEMFRKDWWNAPYQGR